MNIKTESKTVIEINAHYHNGMFKTKPYHIGIESYGEEMSELIDFNGLMNEQIELYEGEYKITITLEKINQ